MLEAGSSMLAQQTVVISQNMTSHPCRSFALRVMSMLEGSCCTPRLTWILPSWVAVTISSLPSPFRSPYTWYESSCMGG